MGTSAAQSKTSSATRAKRVQNAHALSESFGMRQTAPLLMPTCRDPCPPEACRPTPPRSSLLQAQPIAHNQLRAHQSYRAAMVAVSCLASRIFHRRDEAAAA